MTSQPNPEERAYEYHFAIAPGVDFVIYATSLDEAKKFFKEENGLDPEAYEVTRKEPGYSRKGNPFNPNSN